ncbi:MAG: hypothetical protein U0694_12565 [Anaerolineae bacterium]
MNNTQPDSNWKTRAYLMGTLVGTVFGVLSAYLYTRAAEEDTRAGGTAEKRIQTGDLIGLGLAILGIVRQVTELGKSPQGRKK